MTWGSNEDNSTPELNEIRRLRAINAELSEALQATLKHIDNDMNGRPVTLWKLREIVQTAIATATNPVTSAIDSRQPEPST